MVACVCDVVNRLTVMGLAAGRGASRPRTSKAARTRTNVWTPLASTEGPARTKSLACATAATVLRDSGANTASSSRRARRSSLAWALSQQYLSVL